MKKSIATVGIVVTMLMPMTGIAHADKPTRGCPGKFEMKSKAELRAEHPESSDEQFNSGFAAVDKNGDEYVCEKNGNVVDNTAN